jgi:hypothetical protein
MKSMLFNFFFQFCNFLQDHPQENLSMFGDNPYMQVQKCKNIFIFWLQVLDTIVKSYHF